MFWPLIAVNNYAANGVLPSSFPLSADGITRIECGSLGRPSLPRLKIGGSASTTDGGVAPSPSSHVVDSFSPSPTSGHHRTRTQRVRDLLLSIDGLVMESEQAEEALVSLPPLSPDGVRYDASGAGAAVLADRNKRQSTGSTSHSGDRTAGRDSLRTPSDRNVDEPDGPSPGKRTFFPHEKTWGVIAPFPTTPPQELSVRVSSAAGGVAEGIEDGVDYSDKLLAEVDWLIAGTEAALGGVTPEVVNGEAATFGKRGANPVNGNGSDVSLEGAKTDKQGDEGTEQAVERAEVKVGTAAVTGNDAGFVLREKDAKMSEVRLLSSPPEASLTEVSLDTVPSPKTRESDASRTEPESRGSEQTLSPDVGNGVPANKKQTPTVVMRDHFAREREATAVLTSGRDASATAESVGSQSLAVTSVWQEGIVDGPKGEEGRSTMPTVNAVVKTVGENGGPSWGERRAPHGGSPRFEAEHLAPAAMLETLSDTSAPAVVIDQDSDLSRSQRLGNPGADDSDADKGDLGLSAAPFSSLPATKPPFVINGNGSKTGAE